MIEVVRVWKDGKQIQTEVKDYQDDLIEPAKISVVWDEKKDGGKPPTKDEALALFAQSEDTI